MMNSPIMYSFVIPHHNTPDLLQRLIDSIPQREDIEIIVVDDNSDADKKPILKEHLNLQLFLLDATQSKGAGRARNVGLQHAIGKWLIFADSDDFFSDTISELLDKYKDSDKDIIYFKAEGRDSETLEPVSRGMRYNKMLDRFKIKPNKMSEDTLRYLHVVPWCKIIRRSLVMDNNIKFEEVRYSNDVMFIIHVAHCAKTLEVSDVFAYIVTRHSGSLLTQKTNESRRCRFDVSMRRLKFLWDNHKWHIINGVIIILIATFIKYGFSEIRRYFKIMQDNGIGLKHVLVGEFLYPINAIYRYYTYR